MQSHLVSRYALIAALFCSGAFSTETPEEPNLLDLNLETLLTIKVGPSADASLKGLSAPYPGGQVAQGGRIGILSTQDAMDAPFSMTNYTQEFIQNHQAASIGDVLQYDPSVRVARGFGNFQQVYLVRGFPIFSDDMTYNGLYGILPRQYLAAELIERVEVLRGANAFLNGAAPGVSGCLGGAVDAIPKRAPKENLAQITVGAQSTNQNHIATDLAGRSTDGSFGIRFNAVNNDGDTAVEGASNHLGMATLGADYRGSILRVSTDLGYQVHHLDAAQPSITIADTLAIPSPPDADKSIAQPWTYANEEDVFGTFRAEYDFNKNITAWLAGGSRESKENSILSAFMTVNDLAGDFSGNRFDVVHKDSITTGELGLRIQFQSEKIQHKLTLSASGYQNNSDNAYAIYSTFTNNIYRLTEVALPTSVLFTGGNLSHALTTATTQTSSIAIADEMALLDETLLLTMGARHQNIREYNYQYDTGTPLPKYNESQVTPITAAVYKLSPHYSLYTNAIEGLLKGDIAPDRNSNGVVANAGESLQPYQTKQLEIGIKYAADTLGAALGVFGIRKPLAGYNSNNALVILNHQTNRGLELSVYGETIHSLKVLGGVSFLNADVQGKSAIGTPTTQANLDLEWDIPKLNGLTLNGHIMYTGTQFVNAGNTQKLPAWNRIDLGLRYTTTAWNSRRLTIRASVENITDQDYWASVGGFPNSSYLTLGGSRRLQISTTMDF